MGQGMHGGFLLGATERDPFWKAIDKNRVKGDDESSLIHLFNDRETERTWRGFDREADVDGKDWQARHDRDRRRLIDTSYETTPLWCGFWIAEIDGFLCQENGARKLARVALGLDEVEHRFAKRIARLRTRWARFGRFCARRAKVDIGAGRILFVSDWD